MEAFGVISVDGHIDTQWLPEDIFVAAAPASLKDRVPRFDTRPEGRVWTLNGKNLQQASNRVIGQMCSLTDSERHKVLRDNAALLYGFN
jgi:hypothetical protein